MATSKKYPVRVDGRIFDPVAQSESNQAWGKALAFAHRKELTFCECVPRHPIALSVKHYGSTTGGGHYGLARWPATGFEHAVDCVFFSEDAEGGAGAPSNPSFHELAGGLIRVHLARPLALAGAAKATAAAATGPTPDGRPARQRASDTSLLFKLWREANLNLYRAKQVDWFRGSLRLLHTTKLFVIDRYGATLDKRMLFGAVKSSNTACAHNAEVLKLAAGSKGRLYLAARMKTPTDAQRERGKFLLPLVESYGLPKIMVDGQLYDRFLQGRDHFRNLLASQNGNVVVLCCIEPSGGEWWKCVDIAGMATSPDLVPLESSYEGTMERHLVSQGRTFVKPMHVDDGEVGEDQRPDFVLLDTYPRTLIEVWGMNTPEYLSQKAIRLDRYRQKGLTVVSWSADRNEPLPALPPPSPL